MIKLAEVFKFVPVDSEESDMSRRWGQNVVKRWTDTNAWARENLASESASTLASWLGGMRDCVVERDFEHSDPLVAREYQKLLTGPQRQQVEKNPAGALFKSVFDVWAREFGALGQVAADDAKSLFALVKTELEKL